MRSTLVVLALAAPAALALSRPPALFSHGERLVTVGRAPRGLAGTDAGSCAGCHAEIAAEWRTSAHARSWTDDVFQAAYAIEPMTVCSNCHAPLGPARADEGVTCSVCHVRDGRVLGPGSSRAAPHPVLAVRSFTESRYCAGCHQFSFPGDPGPSGVVFATTEPMQDTFGEWTDSESARRGVQCQGCHMPKVNGHTSHAFPGGSDPALLSRAVRVTVTAAREGDDVVVTATVEGNGIGHAFPTGDLFRRAELRVWLDGDEAHRQVSAFARSFSTTESKSPRGEITFVKRESTDTRVPPPGNGPPTPRVLRFRGAAGASVVRWSFEHLLMPTPLAASQGFGTPRNETRIASGTVLLNQGAPR